MTLGSRQLGTLRPEVARLLVALAVIGVSAWIGLNANKLKFGSLGGLNLIIEVMVLAILFGLFLRRIEFGVLALIFSAFFFRISLATGTQTRPPASLVLAFVVIGAWIVGMLLHRNVGFLRSRVNLPLFLFLIIAIISLPWSWLLWRPDLFAWREFEGSGTPFEIVQIGGLSVMVMLPLMAFFAMNAIRTEKWVRYVFLLVIAIGLPELIQRLFDYYPNIGGISLSGPGLYHIWLIGLIYAQVLFNSDLKRWQRVFFVLLMVGWLYWAFALRLEWISGWGPAFVVVFFLTWLKSKRAALLLVLIGVIAVGLRYDYYYSKIILQSQNEDFNRFWLWRTIIFDLTLTKADALLGSGPAGYAPYFQTYYPNLGMSAHNNYVDIIAETGLLGIFAFLWLLFAIFRSGWEQRNSMPNPFLTAFNNGVLAGFVGMLSAMMLNDWFVPFVYNTGISAFDWNVYAWLLVGTMVGLKRFVVQKEQEPNQAPAMMKASQTISPARL